MRRPMGKGLSACPYARLLPVCPLFRLPACLLSCINIGHPLSPLHRPKGFGPLPRCSCLPPIVVVVAVRTPLLVGPASPYVSDRHRRPGVGGGRGGSPRRLRRKGGPISAACRGPHMQSGAREQLHPSSRLWQRRSCQLRPCRGPAWMPHGMAWHGHGHGPRHGSPYIPRTVPCCRDEGRHGKEGRWAVRRSSSMAIGVPLTGRVHDRNSQAGPPRRPICPWTRATSAPCGRRFGQLRASAVAATLAVSVAGAGARQLARSGSLKHVHPGSYLCRRSPLGSVQGPTRGPPAAPSIMLARCRPPKRVMSYTAGSTPESFSFNRCDCGCLGSRGRFFFNDRGRRTTGGISSSLRHATS